MLIVLQGYFSLDVQPLCTVDARFFCCVELFLTLGRDLMLFQYSYDIYLDIGSISKFVVTGITDALSSCSTLWKLCVDFSL